MPSKVWPTPPISDRGQLDLHLFAGTVAIRSDDADALRRAHGLLRGWDDPDVVLSDAEVLARLRELPQAISAYRRVLAQQPNNGLAWLGIGEALLRSGDAAAGTSALESAFSLLPKSPYPALDLGLLAIAEGDLGRACRFAQKAATIAPKSTQPQDLRARVNQAGYRCS